MIKKTLPFLSALLFTSTIYSQEQDTATANRIDDFRDNVINYTGQDLLDASFPNSWPIFGTKARMAIGGYVKLDYIQDLNGISDRFEVTTQSVPVAGDGRPVQVGYMNMFARESRFNFDFRGKTDLGAPFRMFFEFDFWNLDRAPFSQSVRLRHAYGVYDRLVIGRTWGTATDLYAVPVTIDFEAGDAVAGTRRAQIRWEDALNDKINYAVGVEMLEYPGINTNGQQGNFAPTLPVVAGRLTRKTANGGRLFIGASLYQLRWQISNTTNTSQEMGWGVSFSGREYFTKNRHFFYFQGSYGNGWGSNILAFINNGSAVVRPDGQLETMLAYSYGGGVTVNISKVLTTSLCAFWTEIDPSQFLDVNEMYKGETLHANLIWSPVNKINSGLEYIYATRHNISGNSGSANRFQFMVKYLIQ